MLKVINLEEGFPTIEEARQRMKRALSVAKQSGCKGVKLIHGYGSTGTGGGIRLAIGRTLQDMRRDGELACVIFGEHWSINDSDTWSLVKRYPALKLDSDLGRKNRGITVVWF